MKKLIYIGALLALAGCGTGGSDDGTKDRAKKEQEASTEVQNRNQAQLAQKMEGDLTLRHRFYSAIEGKFEGTVMVDREAYSMRLVMTRSIPQFKGERTRQLSEIEADLNNLFFNVQVVQWHPSDPASAVGCRMTMIRPNTNLGSLSLTSTDCSNAYNILMTQTGAQGKRAEVLAEELANKINSGEIGSIDNLVGTVQPTWNARTFSFNIKRVQ